MSEKKTTTASEKKTTAKKATPKAKKEVVQDQEVIVAEVEEVQENEVQQGVMIITNENIIHSQVQKFDTTKEMLIERLKDYDYLMNIKVIEDKETYAKVYKDYQEIRNIRLAIQAKEKGILSDIKTITDGVKKYGSEIVFLSSDYESHALSIRTAWEEFVKKQKEEEKAAKEKQLNDRMAELKEKGLLFNIQDGMFEIGSISLNKIDIERMTDKQYEKLCDQVIEQKTAVDKLKAELAAQELERERLAEEERQKEQERIKEQEKQNKALQEQVLSMRNMVLGAKGLVLSGTLYSYNGNTILKQNDVLNCNDIQFMELVASVDSKIKEINDQAELAKQNKIKSEVRASNIEFFNSLGYILDGVHNKLIYKTEVRTITLDSEEFETGTEVLSQDLKDKFSKEIQDLKEEVDKAMEERAKAIAEQEKADQEKAEKERLSKLGDKELWDDYITKLKSVAVPEFKTEEYELKLTCILAQFL